MPVTTTTGFALTISSASMGEPVLLGAALVGSSPVACLAAVPAAASVAGSSADADHAAASDALPAQRLLPAQSTPRWVLPGTSSCTCPSFPSSGRPSACYGYHPSPGPAAELLCSPPCTRNGRHCR